ncbi:RING/FYVE/PHD zinc finger superfamily protein, putative isoform 1 [Quillaja saponaria]|uniref:RING/FYVE/PHD zinc finger superfamily protein, putative isoform 1 n=1 Tax=Quillaja saponaria TaxID=32244 RepID=A0AAD7Q8G7_QUISA|nr:RING/FYVE/PHD zinc finger superfamily protein, putative isoform 1 [Quillaja saponaria]
MDDASDSPSVIPWLWVIEAVASFKDVDISTLHDVIEKAPVIPCDFDKNTREMVSMRCLEGLFGSATGVTSNAHSRLGSKFVPDFSQSCEDVLQHILHEIQLSNLTMDGPELLNWDVQPFTLHKRASMTRYSLQQLKESILEGTHPYTDYLKESSGLAYADQVDDGNHNTPIRKVKGSCSYRAKRKSETMNRNQDGTDDCDFHMSAKKLKLPLNFEFEKGNSVSQHGMELSENSSERVFLLTEREGYLTETLEEGCVLEDGRYECFGSKSRYSSRDEVHRNQSNIPYSAAIMPQHASGDEPCPDISLPEAKDDNECCPEPIPIRKIAADEAEHDVNCYCDAEALGDSDGYRDEKIDVAINKHEFLSSQCIFDQDLLSNTERTDQNLCMRCNKGGQLLGCSKTTCPLVVHENCLGTLCTFDATGKFYCPFCAYSLAISDYLEAKGKASLARKELDIFICKGMGHQVKEHINILHEKRHSTSRSEDDNLHGNSNENNQLLGKEDDEVDHVSEHLNEVNILPAENFTDNRPHEEPSMACYIVNSLCREEETVTNRVVNVIKEEKEGEEKVIQESSAAVRGLEEQNQVPSNYFCVGDKFSSDKANVVSANQSNEKEEIRDEMLEQQNDDKLEEPFCAFGIKPDKDYKPYMRLRRRQIHYAYQASSNLRRKKVPWTAEEENMLKEGVEKLASTSATGIPWRQILEFGGDVFLNGRTPIDLKDKWRNMCKTKR